MGKKILAGLLLILITVMSVGAGAAYYDSFGNYFPDTTVNYGSSADDGIRAALGDDTFNAMQQGIIQNGGINYYNSADPNGWLRPYLGSDTVNAMDQGMNWNNGYVNPGTGDTVTNWMLSNQGTASTSGTYDWMNTYLGSATASYLNSNRNNPEPYWVNPDMSTMSPYWQNVFLQAKADANYYHDKRWENVGSYGL